MLNSSKLQNHGFLFICVTALFIISGVFLFRYAKIKQTFSENLTAVSLPSRYNDWVDASFSEQFCACKRFVSDKETQMNDNSSFHPNSLRLQIYENYYQANYIGVLDSFKNQKYVKNDPIANYFVGNAFVCLQDGAQAAEYWQELSLAWRALNLVWQCNEGNEPNMATAYYDLAISSKPELIQGVRTANPAPIIWNYMAAATIEFERNPDRARQWLQLAQADEYPDGWLIDAELAKLEQQVGNLSKATEYINAAIKKAPLTHESLFFLQADIYLQAGDIDNSVRSLIDLILNNDNSTSVDLWHRVLNTLIDMSARLNPDSCENVKELMQLCQETGCQTEEIASKAASIALICQ